MTKHYDKSWAWVVWNFYQRLEKGMLLPFEKYEIKPFLLQSEQSENACHSK